MTPRETIEGPHVEQRGLWCEVFVEGVIYDQRPRRTLAESGNVMFTTMTMKSQPLHLGATWSAGHQSGERLINSLLTSSTLVGLSVSQWTLGTQVPNPGVSKASFPSTVLFDDTLNAATRVAAKRLSDSRTGEGAATLEHLGRHRNDVVVESCTRVTLMRCRPKVTS